MVVLSDEISVLFSDAQRREKDSIRAVLLPSFSRCRSILKVIARSALDSIHRTDICVKIEEEITWKRFSFPSSDDMVVYLTDSDPTLQTFVKDEAGRFYAYDAPPDGISIIFCAFTPELQRRLDDAILKYLAEDGTGFGYDGLQYVKQLMTKLSNHEFINQTRFQYLVSAIDKISDHA